MDTIQEHLLDPNLYKEIAKCYIKNKSINKNEILVTYADGSRERIWTYNPSVNDFYYCDFIGKTKLEAVFYCDRKYDSFYSR